MNNYYRKQDFVRKYIRDLVDDGLKQMKDPNLSEDMYNIWLKYSQQVLEISTKDYNAEILLKDKNLYLSLNEINVLLSDKIMENVPAILSNLIKSSSSNVFP